MNKHVIRDEHIDIDWAQQRVQINERIDARIPARHSAWRWTVALASATAVALVAWFGVHQLNEIRGMQDDYAQLEEEMDEIIDGRIPGALMVLNDWTEVETDTWNNVPAAYDPFDLNSTDGGSPTTSGAEEEAL